MEETVTSARRRPAAASGTKAAAAAKPEPVGWRSLRDWLALVERAGQLKRIGKEVDPDEELSAITFMATRTEQAPALLFENVKGDRAGSSVLANMLGASKERYALAVGLDPKLSTADMIAASRRVMSRTAKPISVPKAKAPVNEVVLRAGQFDLTDFPAPTFWPGDGGRYIGTGNIVFTRDPETGRINVGCYRQMLHGPGRIGLYCSPGKHGLLDREAWWARGKPLEVVAAYGIDPVLFMLAAQVFGTTDRKHPGVAEFLSQGRVAIAGPIEVLSYSYFATEFPDTFRTAVQIRSEIARRGWQRVVAFQTRNPMHRAHEELCRMAMERLQADGLVIHMLLGKLKPGDIPAAVRDAAIRKMVELYFPHNSTLITGYGFDMLYAGPREALLHAIFRQNMGATHLIVGRDHAGVGDYYGPFDAQEIFDRIAKDALKIEIFKADNTAYSKKLGKVVMMREAPDHTKEDFVLLSGTAVREMLGNGVAPPAEFARPEVAQILIDYYRGKP